jgi:hypothetical protein
MDIGFCTIIFICPSPPHKLDSSPHTRTLTTPPSFYLEPHGDPSLLATLYAPQRMHLPQAVTLLLHLTQRYTTVTRVAWYAAK